MIRSPQRRFAERLRRAARAVGHPLNGPHRICYPCDALVDGERCPYCGRSEFIAPCNGECGRCREEAHP